MSAYTRPSRRRARPKACRECGATYRPTTNSKRCARCRPSRWPHCRLYIVVCEGCGRTTVSGRRRRYCRQGRCSSRRSETEVIGQRVCELCREPFPLTRVMAHYGRRFCGRACLSAWQSERMAERMAARAAARAAARRIA